MDSVSSLGEIEAVATRHESVKAFCAAVKEIGGAQNLVGYYTTKDGAALDAEALRAFMSESLTEFMVPSVIMPLKEMPLTPNGKDRPPGVACAGGCRCRDSETGG